MTNIYSFRTVDESESFVCADADIGSAEQQARDVFGHDSFSLESQHTAANWEDFIQKYTPLRLLPFAEGEEKEEDPSASYFFIEPWDTKQIKGFNDLVVAQHVWTILDVDGLLYIVPGWHFVNRFAYIVTEQKWSDQNEEFVYA